MCVLFFERGIDMTEEQNLLSGSVSKKLAAFAFPLLLANILQSFYNVVDMLVVGQIVGDAGLAAINNASKLCYIIKLRQLTSRSRCGSIVQTMEKIKVYMRGWLNYYGIADMKNNIESLNGWLYRRIRMCIWKQWKLPRTRMRKLIGLGVDSHYAATIAYDRKGYWFNAGNKAVNWALSKERLINWGLYDLTTAYQSLHVNY